MYWFRRVVVSLLCLAALTAAMSFKISKSKLILQFDNYVGNELLKLDSAKYKNDMGQEFTVSRFKYYISAIELKKSNGTSYTSAGYYIVNEEEPVSKQITLDD